MARNLFAEQITVKENLAPEEYPTFYSTLEHTTQEQQTQLANQYFTNNHWQEELQYETDDSTIALGEDSCK